MAQNQFTFSAFRSKQLSSACFRMAILLAALLGFGSVDSSLAQTMLDPWPYDSVKYYEHDLNTVAQDSTLTRIDYYSINENGHRIGQIRLSIDPGSGMRDTSFRRVSMPNQFGRDTVIEFYAFPLGLPSYLSSKSYYTYYPSELIQSSRLYIFSASGDTTQINQSYYWPDGRRESFVMYDWGANGELSLIWADSSFYWGSNLIETKIWGQFSLAGGDSLLLRRWLRYYYNQDSLIIGSRLEAIPFGDSVLQATDSI